MKKILYPLVFVSLMGMATGIRAEEKSGKNLPDFSLKDPAGKIFTKKDISQNGVVMVVTAPILSNQSEQEGWDKQLGQSRSGAKGKLVFLQDMGPSSFKNKALKEMKKEYQPGKEPILLIDPDGSLRKKLGVEEKDTVVMVFDKDGKLIHQETGQPSAAGAQKAWKSLSK